MAQTYAIYIYYDSEFYDDFFANKILRPRKFYAYANFQISIFSKMRGRNIL